MQVSVLGILAGVRRHANVGDDFPYPSQPQDAYIVENGLLSLYDHHSDGSGVCHSSGRRPQSSSTVATSASSAGSACLHIASDLAPAK